MKKIISLILAAFLINICIPLLACGAIIDEKITENYITKGVTHTNIKRLTTDGWYNINYVKANLDEPSVDLKILTNENISKKSTVLEMCKNEPSVVAAVNADFFTTYTQTAACEGMLIKDGKLITSSSADPSYATFGINEEKKAFADYFKTDIMVTSKRTNESSNILFYNKNASPMYMKIYDSNFGSITPGSMDDGYEVVVEDGIVTEVLSNKPGVEIPKNGYVLHNSLRYSLFLSQNFSVGDEVELKISISPNASGIKEAVGGGTLLLKDGKQANFTLKDSRQPMTALGIDKSGKNIYLLTVDGRMEQSRGMTFKETSDFLLSLGCYNAISFDGGGSTTLALKKPSEDITNENIQTTYRSVINSVGIVKENKTGSFFDFEISLSEKNTFVNLPVEIYISKAYDEYGNSVVVNGMNVKYSSDKKGSFDNYKYTPKEEGTHRITVDINGKKNDILLNVYNNPINLETNVLKFEKVTTPQSFAFIARDAEGYGSYVPSDYLTTEFVNCKGYVKEDKLYLTEAADGFITFSYKDAVYSVAVGNYSVENTYKDKFYKKAESGYSFGVFGSLQNKTSLFSKIIEGKIVNEANKLDIKAFLSVPDCVNGLSVKVSNYGREDTRDSLFIKLDNSRGGIVKTKPEQWDWLLNVFKKGVNANNVFINMPLCINKVTDKDELEILINILKKNLPGKNIFIITYGDENKYKVQEGIRYITIRDIPAIDITSPFKVFNYLKYGKFYINGNDVSFFFESLI